MSSLSFKRRISVVLIVFVIAATAFLMLNPMKSIADSSRDDNIGRHNHWTHYNWATCSYSYLAATSDGGYMIFEGSRNGDDYLVEYYDSSFNLKSTKTVSRELPLFGAFYSDGTNFFVLTGQENLEESATVECFRVTKYDQSWTRLSSCGLYDCDTYAPFSAGGASVTSSGKYLVVRTCYVAYALDDGIHHQSNFTFMIDSSSMEMLGNYDDSVSHSFNQYVKIDDNHVVGADLGDAFPRAIVVSRYAQDITSGSFGPFYLGGKEYDVLPIPGMPGDNYTGATLGGLEITSSSYIVVGSAENNIIDRPANGYVKDVFVGSVDKSSGSISLKILTDCEGVDNPFIVKISDSRLAVIWSKYNKLYYTFVDGSGNQTGSIFSEDGYLSDCQPILSDGKILWYVYDGDAVIFYSIDAFSGAFTTYGTAKPTPTPTATPTPTPSITHKNEWVQMGGEWFYYDDNGNKVTGWYKVGAWYYFDEFGVMQTGWQLIDGKWYYLRPSGSMYTGWLPWGNTYYYLDSSGAMVTGWKKISGTWYYFLGSGAMVKGWKQIDGIWYYLESDGAMHTGWLLSGSTWYYFNNSGAMVTGWKSSGGNWYYFDSDGAMKTGWLEDAGKWYYLAEDGHMVTGKVVIDGKEYIFDTSGACLNK